MPYSQAAHAYKFLQYVTFFNHLTKHYIMGLAEKRGVKQFQDGSYARLVEEINAIAGYKIDFEVNWDSLAVEGLSHLYEEGFSKVYFIPIKNALKEITVDDIGKEALKDTLKKFIIKNDGDIASAGSAYTFNDGAIIINHRPAVNIDDIKQRSDKLSQLLMSKM